MRFRVVIPREKIEEMARSERAEVDATLTGLANTPILTRQDRVDDTEDTREGAIYHTDDQTMNNILVGEDHNNQISPTLGSTTLWIFIAITAVVLLAATYVGLVLYLKRRRRHRRATHPDPNQRTVGAFLDGVDFMVDLGAPLKRSATDIELVGIASRAVGGTVTLLEPVAELSTAAVYDRTPSSDVDADDAWHTVDQFEDHTSQQLGTVRLWRSRLSTRSLRRGIGS